MFLPIILSGVITTSILQRLLGIFINSEDSVGVMDWDSFGIEVGDIVFLDSSVMLLVGFAA